MRTRIKISMLMLVLLAIITLGCGSSNKPENKPAASPPPQNQHQSITTMKATTSQFIEIYNKEIKQRLSDKSVLGTEKPVRDGVVMYDIPDGKGSHLILNYNPADKKLTTVTFTVQGESGKKFESNTMQAWATAVISATAPGVSNDNVLEIRGKLLNDNPVIKNGIYYMSQYTEKGAPFFQIIARAQ
ncbi:hypothetical protein [Sporomusa sphaeroides]|uniref:Lipoprotein n=1 Tax=Sporomusa sphaeroides DSM 2875 TaxID=1337886 RepID=A0ABP2C4I0_9FIRM|nr:hypothetical protein [Sporomusa sphaeroides]OLS56336.1 hypothetical protein SPSPH_27290 [Sporomusa sphaeroides DSM 2875]CVK18431.1 hypothetical protein SSPH_01069 [Sporomusa sphaeroides DSM 2875]